MADEAEEAGGGDGGEEESDHQQHHRREAERDLASHAQVQTRHPHDMLCCAVLCYAMRCGAMRETDSVEPVSERAVTSSALHT